MFQDNISRLLEVGCHCNSCLERLVYRIQSLFVSVQLVGVFTVVSYVNPVSEEFEIFSHEYYTHQSTYFLVPFLQCGVKYCEYS